MYKRESKKIRPVNIPLSGGINPGGGVNDGTTPIKGPWISHGSRLTPEYLAFMNIGTGFLTPAERILFINILYKYESAIAFDDSEMGLL